MGRKESFFQQTANWQTEKETVRKSPFSNTVPKTDSHKSHQCMRTNAGVLDDQWDVYITLKHLHINYDRKNSNYIVEKQATLAKRQQPSHVSRCFTLRAGCCLCAIPNKNMWPEFNHEETNTYLGTFSKTTGLYSSKMSMPLNLFFKKPKNCCRLKENQKDITKHSMQTESGCYTWG